MQFEKIVLSALISAAALASGASHAASVSFDFGATGGTQSNGTGYGNVRTYTQGGLTATVTTAVRRSDMSRTAESIADRPCPPPSATTRGPLKAV